MMMGAQLSESTKKTLNCTLENGIFYGAWIISVKLFEKGDGANVC